MIQTVELYKPEGKSLGFKVVGLNHPSSSSDSSSLSITSSILSMNKQQQKVLPPVTYDQIQRNRFIYHDSNIFCVCLFSL